MLTLIYQICLLTNTLMVININCYGLEKKKANEDTLQTENVFTEEDGKVQNYTTEDTITSFKEIDNSTVIASGLDFPFDLSGPIEDVYIVPIGTLNNSKNFLHLDSAFHGSLCPSGLVRVDA